MTIWVKMTMVKKILIKLTTMQTKMVNKILTKTKMEEMKEKLTNTLMMQGIQAISQQIMYPYLSLIPVIQHLMARLQNALTKQLTDEHERVDLQLREKVTVLNFALRFLPLNLGRGSEESKEKKRRNWCSALWCSTLAC